MVTVGLNTKPEEAAVPLDSCVKASGCTDVGDRTHFVTVGQSVSAENELPV